MISGGDPIDYAFQLQKQSSSIGRSDHQVSCDECLEWAQKDHSARKPRTTAKNRSLNTQQQSPASSPPTTSPPISKIFTLPLAVH